MKGRGDWLRRKQPRKKKKKNLQESERVTLQELLEGWESGKFLKV